MCLTHCHLTHKSATWAEICVTRAKLAKICVKFPPDFRFRLALRRALPSNEGVPCPIDETLFIDDAPQNRLWPGIYVIFGSFLLLAVSLNFPRHQNIWSPLMA